MLRAEQHLLKTCSKACWLIVQEQSFKEYAQRPENKALLEQHQQQEVSAALQLQEQMQELQLQQQVCRAMQTLCTAGSYVRLR